jgi:hypothetical protein
MRSVILVRLGRRFHRGNNTIVVIAFPCSCGQGHTPLIFLARSEDVGSSTIFSQLGCVSEFSGASSMIKYAVDQISRYSLWTHDVRH